MNEYSVQQPMSGFVDDTTIWVNNLHSNLHSPLPLQRLMTNTQQTAQWWEKLLHASGGKLELSKCFYYLIVWLFDDDGNPYLAQFEPSPLTAITLNDSSSTTHQQISLKQSTHSHKTLGVFENPSGNYEDEHRVGMKNGKKDLLR